MQHEVEESVGAGPEEKEQCLLGEEKEERDGRSSRLVTFLSLLTQPFLVTSERERERGGEPVVTNPLGYWLSNVYN